VAAVTPAPPPVVSSPCGSGVVLASVSSRSAVPLSAAEECALKAKDEFKECATCPAMVVIPAGSFTMGSPKDEEGREDDEGPQHQVTIAKPFAAGKFHVTVAEFSAFVAETGYDAGSKCWIWTKAEKWEETAGRSFRDPGYAQSGNHPAACLSWNDAKAYATWLSRKTGKSYRLLSEAEWEYAARGRTAPGSYPRYFYRDSEGDMCRFGNGADQAAKRKVPGSGGWTVFSCNDGYAYTSPVGSFAANPFGLYDMLGNAWQWVEDCYYHSYAGAPTDGSPSTTDDCGRRVVRGGSWYTIPRYLRSATRSGSNPGIRDGNGGIRLARTVTP